MDQQEPAELTLESRDLGALPIINRIFERLELHQLLGEVLAEKTNLRLSHASAILLLVRNILVDRHPLYKLSEWAGRFDPHLVGLGTADASLLNDDRSARSLDALFDADRASLLTALVLRVVQRFAVELDQLHNDSTTVTVFGEYPAERSTRKGKRSVALTFGYNKDHRQDLKQLLFTLTVSRDGAVPIHYKSYDGSPQTRQRCPIALGYPTMRNLTGCSPFSAISAQTPAQPRQ